MGNNQQISDNSKASYLNNMVDSLPNVVSDNVSFTDINGKFVYHSNCFIIITGSYTEEINAISAVRSMKLSGYANVGYLWRLDYPSINDKSLFSTFIGPFTTYTGCENNLRRVKEANTYWYGIKVSYDKTRVEIR